MQGLPYMIFCWIIPDDSETFWYRIGLVNKTGDFESGIQNRMLYSVITVQRSVNNSSN